MCVVWRTQPDTLHPSPNRPKEEPQKLPECPDTGPADTQAQSDRWDGLALWFRSAGNFYANTDR